MGDLVPFLHENLGKGEGAGWFGKRSTSFCTCHVWGARGSTRGQPAAVADRRMLLQAAGKVLTVAVSCSNIFWPVGKSGLDGLAKGSKPPPA